MALTKIDLVPDEEWLELVEADLHQVFRGTVLENAPLIRVSARTRQGIPDLLAALRSCLAEAPARLDLGRPRLPIDRIFTITGFGTVVTGTLTDGRFSVGDDVEILPDGVQGRVRGLQTHKHKLSQAVPGSRTAVNISGVTTDQVKRGDVVCHPGDYHSTRRLDVHFRLLADASQPVHHNSTVKLFIGASETLARIRLLGTDELHPGEEGWLQLEPFLPVLAVRGDRYILRRPSPGETLGGGAVMDPHPKGRYKRRSAEALQRLNSLLEGTPAEVVFQACLQLGAAPLREVVARSNLDLPAAQAALTELLASGQILLLETEPVAGLKPDTLLVSQSYWSQFSARLLAEVDSYHRAYPLRSGMPREELKSRLKAYPSLTSHVFSLALARLVNEGQLVERGPLVLKAGYQVRFTPQQQALVDGLLARFAAAPYAPPTVKDCQAEVGDELFGALLELDYLVLVSAEVVFRREDYERMVSTIRQLLSERGVLTAAEVRDYFDTSRRYSLALLEHLDAAGITQRDGDVRRMRH